MHKIPDNDVMNFGDYVDDVGQCEAVVGDVTPRQWC